MNQLLQLIGKKITNAISSTGPIYPLSDSDFNIQQQRMIDELVLSIEDYSLGITNRMDFHTEIKSVNDLIGLTIHSIEESDSSILITTTNGMWLSVDLRPEAFLGPEALVLHGPDNLCVVWN